MSRRKRPHQDPAPPAPSSGAAGDAPSASASAGGVHYGPEPASRVRVRYLFVVLAAQAVLLVAFYGFAWIGAPPPRLLTEDVLARPGETVTLRARWERDVPPLLFSLRSGIEVSFEATTPAGPIGPLRATTDANGFASVEVTLPNAPGVLEFRVSAASGRTSAEGPSELQSGLHVQIVAADTPLVLTSIAGGLSRTPSLQYTALPAPRPAAAETLVELAQRGRAIVYLHVGVRQPVDDARRWLREHGFPTGAILAPEAPSTRPEDRALDVRRELETALAGRPTAERGIASQRYVITAYSLLGIPALEIGASERAFEAGQTVEAALDWTTARRILLEKP